MNFLNLRVIIIFCAFLCLMLTACKNAENSRPSTKDKLIIGLESEYPPFEFVDEKGNLVGFDVDVANQIATALQKKLEFKSLDFEQLIPALKQGNIDLILSGMSITPERLNEIKMIPYHGDEPKEFSLLFWEKIPENVSTITDVSTLANPTISVEAGTIAEQFLSNFPNIKVRVQKNALKSFLDIKNGDASANLVDQDAANYLKKLYPQIQMIPVPVELKNVLGIGIGVKKNDDGLAEQVSVIITSLRNSGELKKLEDKWFNQ